jgi:DNA-binding MarR family transcriptional regulator
LGSRLYRVQEEELSALSSPLSVRQFRILDRVERGLVALSMHAEVTARRPSTISKSADSLVRRGLLTRTRADEDRRVVILGLTYSGKRLLREARMRLEQAALGIIGVDAYIPDGIEEFLAEVLGRVSVRLGRRERALPPDYRDA